LVIFRDESILSLPGSCFLAFSFLLVHDLLEEWKFLWVRDLVPERKKKWGNNEKRNSWRWGGCFPGLDMPCWLYAWHGIFMAVTCN
jgi:hypothetical protein